MPSSWTNYVDKGENGHRALAVFEFVAMNSINDTAHTKGYSVLLCVGGVQGLWAVRPPYVNSRSSCLWVGVLFLWVELMCCFALGVLPGCFGTRVICQIFFNHVFVVHGDVETE